MIDESVKIHPQALVESNVSIKKNTRVWAFVHILPNVKIGENCNICDYCYIEGGVVIGNNVTIKNGISIWEGVVLEDKVFLGPNAVFTNDMHPRSKKPCTCLSTLVKEGASVGANSVIVCGNTIGKYALIGAGSVVTHNIPDYALAYGNPAQIRGFVCQCTRTLHFDETNSTSCSCGLHYKKTENTITLL